MALGTSSLLRTWEKSLALLLLGPDCGFGKPWLEGAGVLEKANVQVLGVKGNLCRSLYEEDASQTRIRLMAPNRPHLPVALNGEFDFHHGDAKARKGRKAREWVKHLP